MSADSQPEVPLALSTAARRFAVDLVRCSGRKGVLALLFAGLGALVEGLSLAMVVPLIGLVTAAQSAAGPLQSMVKAAFAVVGVTAPGGRLALLTVLFGLLMLVRGIVLAVRGVLLAELQIGFVAAQRLRLTRNLVAARWDHVVRLRHARITHVMSGDIQRIASGASALLQGGAAAAMLVVQCVLAFLLNAPFALVAFALLLVGMMGLVPMARRAHHLGGHVTGMGLKLLDDTSQFLGGLKIAVSQNQQAGYVEQFRAVVCDLAGRFVAVSRQQVISQLAMATISSVIGTALVLVGFAVFQIPAPVLITLLLVIVRMSAPAAQVQQSSQLLAQSLPAYEKVCELNDELANARSADVKAPRPVPEGAIRFEHVSFTYDGEEARGVEDISLTIAVGEFLGLGGPSGAGKTTFADLLVGLYPPQAGSITIGDVVLGETTLAAWRDAISYVSQDAFLFHDTVRANLGWANQAGEDEMWQALAIAGADDFVRRIGLDSMVGERGTLVSGGERQRIALARAILRRPRLLVLDEATNAIDIAGERAILDRLAALEPRPTIVMIAHRRESHAGCERVVWLEGGRLTDTEPS